MIISVGVVVPSPELAGYPPGILYLSGTLVLFEDALLECLEGSRVMGIVQNNNLYLYTHSCNLCPKVATQQYTILLTLGSPRLLASIYNLLGCIHRKCVVVGLSNRNTVQ